MNFLPPERPAPVPQPLRSRDPLVVQMRGRRAKLSQRARSLPPAQSCGNDLPRVLFPGGLSPADAPMAVAQVAAAELIYVQSLEFLKDVVVPPGAMAAVAEVGGVLVEFDGSELSLCQWRPTPDMSICNSWPQILPPSPISFSSRRACSASSFFGQRGRWRFAYGWPATFSK